MLFIIRWFITAMSAEKIISQEVNDLPPSSTPKKSEEVSSTGRVDINTLLARARNKQRQETKINFVFFTMFVALILVVGIILSF